MKRIISKYLVIAYLCLFTIPIQAVEKVSIGVPSWAGAQAIAHLIHEVVTKKLGGQAEFAPGTNATIFQAMDQGKGAIDIHPDVWLPNQETFTKKYVDSRKTVVLSKNSYKGVQSFCVTKTFSKKNKVTSIFDLARPEIAKKMDSDGNGKGEIWIGAPGWASANVNEIKVRDYGLLPFIEPIRAEQSVMVAKVGESIKKKQGFAFYCYSPHSIWFLYDVVRLSEPKHNPAKYKVVQPAESPDWYKLSKVSSADAVKKVQIAYSKSLKKRSPGIAKLVANIKLTSDDVGGWVYQTSKGKKAEEVIAEWVRKNSKRVDSWLGL